MSAPRRANECLIKASHDAEFCVENLRQALHSASAVESLLLLPMIETAVVLSRNIDALLEARTLP